MAWRVAKSLEILRKQINDTAPKRSKVNDGTIGDLKHRARASDHNPDRDGVVKAMDITHDPQNGCDVNQIAEALRAAKDFRVKYMIWNLRICSSTESPWKWRKGNDHEHHLHVSVKAAKSIYDSEAAWPIVPGIKVPDAPPMPKKVPVLRKGSKGTDVKRFQLLLGFSKADSDGKFGRKTDEAVRAFQKKAGLVADGIVGFYTWKELEKK